MKKVPRMETKIAWVIQNRKDPSLFWCGKSRWSGRWGDFFTSRVYQRSVDATNSLNRVVGKTLGKIKAVEVKLL